MRDVNRIDPFCDKLKEIWKEVPDWRFGQLMSNILNMYYSEFKRDPFFVEDKEFLDFMQHAFEKKD